MREVYIALRLFNFSDKIQAELFEQELLKHQGIESFMPFRDTNENQLFGENRTRIIYDADIRHLDSGNVSVVAALFDGICKDEGISFELGYAFGRKIPIYAINTDFIWYSMKGKEFLFDPVLEFMLNGYTHVYSIPEQTPFLNALYLGQESAFKDAATHIAEIVSTGAGSAIKYNELLYDERTDVTIEFGGGRYEYQREYAKQIEQILKSNGLHVLVTDRFYPTNTEEILRRGIQDTRKVYQSDIFVFIGDELELNSGTAALLGFARSLRKKCIMYESSSVEIRGENGHKMRKNLMIDFSVDKVASNLKLLIDYIMERKQDGK